MRITNPNNPTVPFYAGTCKNNTAPKHVETGTQKKIKLDKKPAVMFDSPRSTGYIYIKQGENWLFVKDKSIFAFDSLETTKVTRSKAGEPEVIVVEDTAK